MTSLFRIILLITLSSFVFTNTATAMLCDINDMNSTETHDNAKNTDNESCHDKKQQSPEQPLDDCCHDMNLCHASLFVLSGSETLSQIYINHYSIQKRENDNLVINSSSPPDRPPKHLA